MQARCPTGPCSSPILMWQLCLLGSGCHSPVHHGRKSARLVPLGSHGSSASGGPPARSASSPMRRSWTGRGRCTTATPVAVRTSGMWGGEPCQPRGISMVRCSTPLARWRRQEYQRKQQQPSVAGLSAFLGRFLPKLGGASRCRPFFACAGGTRHSRLCHVSAGPATYVILRHDGRPLVFRLCGILPCRP